MIIQHLRELLFLTLANSFTRIIILDRYRYILYKWAGLNIKGSSYIFGPLIIRPIGKANNIYIGSKTFINTEVRFGCPNSTIRIGDKCLIGPRVSFETVNHTVHLDEFGNRDMYTKEINIEKNVWIGCGSIILQGVTIGEGSVIAAGSVVNKNVPPNQLYGGVPARFIRSLN